MEDGKGTGKEQRNKIKEMIKKEKTYCEFHSPYLCRISIGICYDYVHVTQTQFILVREVTTR
jgi:hypothetical protein